ncbi:glycosyltransferase 87 family protein [Actinocatenispora sera]|uniref:glycosyltransferase 87 family protein n=1 Tax=Actinocatenispora sera TaxID=390989 RepID=UPI001FD4A611|nr:glycosyltransferase 87 family protein [Actinocatenispora sera]
MTLTGIARATHRAGRGTVVDIALYAVSAGYAGIIAFNTGMPAHAQWGRIAVFGYLALTVLAVVQRFAGRGLARPAVRMVLVFAGWAATTLLPLLIEAAQRAAGASGRAQDEVTVVEMAGARLVDTGSPYLSHDGIVGALPSLGYLAYVPYNPGIAVFGLPRRYAGDQWWTDARVGFALVTAAAIVAALVLLRRLAPASVLVRAAQVATLFPVCALTLATGGDDLPVLALCLLGLAFAVRARVDDRGGAVWWLLSGLVVGDAAAMKLFALPVLVVLAVFVGFRAGGRSLGWYLTPALALPVVTLGPIALRDPDGVLENLVRYPLGRGLAESPAASNLPGHLIAVLLPGGQVVAAGLLVAAGLAFVIHLLVRPPADVATVAWRVTAAMLLAICLAPATRFGYLLYPAAYAVWAVALRIPREPVDKVRHVGVRVATAMDPA